MGPGYTEPMGPGYTEPMGPGYTVGHPQVQHGAELLPQQHVPEQHQLHPVGQHLIAPGGQTSQLYAYPPAGYQHLPSSCLQPPPPGPAHGAAAAGACPPPRYPHSYRGPPPPAAAPQHYAQYYPQHRQHQPLPARVQHVRVGLRDHHHGTTYQRAAPALTLHGGPVPTRDLFFEQAAPLAPPHPLVTIHMNGAANAHATAAAMDAAASAAAPPTEAAVTVAAVTAAAVTGAAATVAAVTAAAPAGPASHAASGLDPMEDPTTS